MCSCLYFIPSWATQEKWIQFGLSWEPPYVIVSSQPPSPPVKKTFWFFFSLQKCWQNISSYVCVRTQSAVTLNKSLLLSGPQLPHPWDAVTSKVPPSSSMLFKNEIVSPKFPVCIFIAADVPNAESWTFRHVPAKPERAWPWHSGFQDVISSFQILQVYLKIYFIWKH